MYPFIMTVHPNIYHDKSLKKPQAQVQNFQIDTASANQPYDQETFDTKEYPGIILFEQEDSLNTLTIITNRK